MKKISYKLFHPNKVIGCLICIISVILLIYVFSLHIERTPLAYTSYLLSTYSLILFIIWFIKACHFSSVFIKEKKLYILYKKREHIILKITLLISSIFNLGYGMLKLSTGIYYKSWWFITFAIYYLILCIMKSLLLKDTKVFGDNIDKEYKKLKNTGIILLLLNIVLTGMIILIIRHDYYFSYPGYLIYIIAMYDFYLIISAFINVFKYKSYRSPIISASKCISLTVAMISMLSLEVAMIYEFGNNDNNFKLIMTSCTGFGICLINTVMSIVMIYNGRRKDNKKCHY
ncbi:MAG: hypothetical protein ACI4XR_04510 [Bacilli bacterium]